MARIPALLIALLTVLTASNAFSQADETAKRFHILPHIADGGGWASTLLVTNVSSSASPCTLQLYGGLDVDRFVSGAAGITAIGSTATFQLSGEGGYLIWWTRGESSLASGYATLDCVNPVTAQVIFASVNSFGATTGMATVFSSQAATLFQFPVLQPEAALGFAIANNTNSEASCRFALANPDGTTIDEASLSVPSKSNQVQLLNEAISIPATFAGGTAAVGCDRQVAMLGLHFELQPGGDIATFTTLPPAILSTTPASPTQPTKPFNQQQTERLIGTWVFTYTIISDRTATYRLSNIQESSTRPGDWFIGGTDEFGDIVVAGYSSRSGDFYLLDPGITIDHFYTFDFSGSNTVSGCYYLVDKDDDSLSRCYTMTGIRTSASPRSLLTRSLSHTTAAQAELGEIGEVERLESGVQIEVDPKIIQVLKDFRGILAQ